MMHTYFRPMAVCAAFALAGLALPVAAQETYPPLDILLSTSETVIGQPFAYPEGVAKITSAIVTMVPGQQTGWHLHKAPVFGYILEGALTVDYGPLGSKTYETGDSLIDAFGTRHNGTNSGEGRLRILVVFAGAEGTPNTIAEDN